MRVRTVHYIEIPVIQIPSTPPGVPPLNLLEQLPYEVVMLHVMLPLDAVDILNLCTASAVIQQICMDEYFWKQKTIRDFGTEDRPLGDDTWKNVYFNKLDLSRKLKQRIQSGDIESVREITNALLNSESIINLNDFITVALNAGQREIVRFLIPQLRRAPNSIGGRDVLCLMARTPNAVTLFQDYFAFYLHLDLWSTSEFFDNLLKCVIQSKKKTLVRGVYMRYLNRHGDSTSTKPRVFVEYAKSLGHTEIIKTIQDTYTGYKKARERVRANRSNWDRLHPI